MDLKKMLALAMLALMVIPSLTMVVKADEPDEGVGLAEGAGPAGAIERARIYLNKVMTSAEKTAALYPEDENMQRYLEQLNALLGQYEYEGPEILFQTGGSGIVEWSSDEHHSESRSAKLYVVNGGTDWAEVSIPVDIALNEITELKFWEYIESYTPADQGWSVNVVLGIDLGNDGFTADVAGWHVGTNAWTLAALNGDTFVEMDGVFGDPVTGSWTETDALSIAQWWTPNKDCTAFAGSDEYPFTFYGSLADFVNVLIPSVTQDSLIPSADARVKCVKLLIGGSVNWMDETAYVDDIDINGTPYDFEEKEAKDGQAKVYLDQASAYLGEGDIRSAARSLASARNIIGRVNGLLKSMAKAHKVARTERFNQKFRRRIEGIEDKIERPKGPRK